jgi:hypothetical protein
VAGGDAHTGILIVNMLCCLGAAGAVYLASRRFTSRVVAACAAVAMLYMPVSFWMAGQDLAEPLSTLLIAGAVYLAVRWPRSAAAWLGAEALAGLAAVGRIWTLPLLLVLPVGMMLLDEGRVWPRRLARAAGVLAAGAAVYIPLSRLFSNYGPAAPVFALLDVSLASNNMVLYLTVAPQRTMNAAGVLAGIVRNTFNALRAQVSVANGPLTVTRLFPAADLWPVNLTVVLAASGLFLRGTDRLRRCVMALAVIAFGMHLAVAVLLQNAPRYVVPLLPPIVLGAAVASGLWLERERGRRWVTYAAAALMCVTLVAFLAVDVVNARYFRTDALGTGIRRANVAALVDRNVPATARVVLDTRFGGRWPADYAIFPRPELALGTDFRTPDADYVRMMRLFRPGFLVTDSTSRLPETMGRLDIGAPERLGTASGYTLWRIRPAAPATAPASAPTTP